LSNGGLQSLEIDRFGQLIGRFGVAAFAQIGLVTELGVLRYSQDDNAICEITCNIFTQGKRDIASWFGRFSLLGGRVTDIWERDSGRNGIDR
jgi:hypothetical protein